MAGIEPAPPLKGDCSDTMSSKSWQSLDSLSSGTLEDVKYLPTGYELKEWIAQRERTIQMLKDIAGEIDKHCKRVNKTRIAGSSAAVAGGLMILGASVATLATAGLAAPITAPIIVAGTVVSIAVGAASTGASITKSIISKVKPSKAQEQIDADNKMMQELLQLINDMRSPRENYPEAAFSVLSTIARVGTGVPVIAYTGGRAAATAVRAGKNVPRLGQVGRSVARGGAAAVRVGSVALQGAAAASIAVEIVIIPMNIAEIVKNRMSLY